MRASDGQGIVELLERPVRRQHSTFDVEGDDVQIALGTHAARNPEDARVRDRDGDEPQILGALIDWRCRHDDRGAADRAIAVGQHKGAALFIHDRKDQPFAHVAPDAFRGALQHAVEVGETGERKLRGRPHQSREHRRAGLACAIIRRHMRSQRRDRPRRRGNRQRLARRSLGRRGQQRGFKAPLLFRADLDCLKHGNRADRKQSHSQSPGNPSRQAPERPPGCYGHAISRPCAPELTMAVVTRSVMSE